MVLPRHEQGRDAATPLAHPPLGGGHQEPSDAPPPDVRDDGEGPDLRHRTDPLHLHPGPADDDGAHRLTAVQREEEGPPAGAGVGELAGVVAAARQHPLEGGQVAVDGVAHLDPVDPHHPPLLPPAPPGHQCARPGHRRDPIVTAAG